MQVNGCCTGEISKALQVVYPSILECRAIGIGLKPLALDVTVQPGERKPPPPSPPPPSPPPPVSSGTGSNGTILDGGTVGANLTNASGSSDKVIPFFHSTIQPCQIILPDSIPQNPVIASRKRRRICLRYAADTIAFFLSGCVSVSHRNVLVAHRRLFPPGLCRRTGRYPW